MKVCVKKIANEFTYCVWNIIGKLNKTNMATMRNVAVLIKKLDLRVIGKPPICTPQQQNKTTLLPYSTDYRPT
jgi:hypothetical protein